MKNKKKSITTRNSKMKIKISKLYKEIWIIAYPLIIMSANSTIMEFVDRKF